MNAHLRFRVRSWLRRVLLGGEEVRGPVAGLSEVQGEGDLEHGVDGGLGCRRGDAGDFFGFAAAEPSRGTGRIDPPLKLALSDIQERYRQINAAIDEYRVPRDMALVLALRVLNNDLVEEGVQTDFAKDRAREAEGFFTSGGNAVKVH